MADVKDLKPYRRRKKRRSNFWRTIIISIILISVFLFVAFSEGWIDKDFFEQIVNKPEGFPVAVTGGKPQSILKSNNDIVLITDTDLVYYDKHGTILSQTVHNCTNPHIITKNKKLLVYDKGYSFYQIQNKNEVLHSASSSNRLTNADLADNGSYAIATTSTRYLSEMTVYNKNNKEICYWKSVNSYISSLSFSNNSKKLAVASIFADSGYFNTNIRIFDLNKENDPVICDINFTDSAIVKIQYLNSGKILVIFDNSYIIINENGEIIQENKFESDNELYFQNINEDGGVVILKGTDQKLTLNRIFSDPSKITAVFPLKQNEFKSLTFSNNSVFILQDDKIYEYPNTENCSIKIDNIADTFDICEKNDALYTLNFTQINNYQ